MEFDEILVKDTPGLCRCCLSEGCYKDLATEYNWMSDTEVYADMLLECFDISISQHTEGPNGPNRLICEVCITRLRDACNFKKQVVESETKFVDMMAKGEFKSKVTVAPPPMKAEADEVHLEGATAEFLDDDMDFDVDDDKDDSGDDPSYSGDITVDALPVKNKRGRPRKNATIVKTEKKSKVAKLEEKPRTSKVKGAKFSSVEDKYKKQEIARKLEIKRKNVECILKSANVTPFMWYKGRYRCFYCTEPMKNPEMLREHTSKIHQFANIETVVCKRVKSNRDKDAAVKIDIRDLACRICAKTLTNLDQFVNHIIIAHDAEYDMSVPNCLLPFRLDKDNPSCATCNMKFIFFEYLLRHANKNHLSHDYMCDICGTSFQGENHMKMHNRYYHREGGYNCEYCDVSFVTLSKKIQHEKNVHLVNLSTCPHCPETFKSPYFKKLHLANVHGVEEMRFECRYCRKVYPQESIMSRHMRRVHLREKNVECSVCGDKFFSAYEVKLHMVKHNGEKKFVCSHCGKRCTTKSNLNAHLLSHSTIKRYRCEICLTAFTHQSNLKYHLKQKHFRTDVNINNEQDDVESDAAKLGVPDDSELDKEQFIEMELVDDNFNGTEDLNQYINID